MKSFFIYYYYYIFLGIVESDTCDSTPIAAELWDKIAGEGLVDRKTSYVELARKHPGDKFVDDSKHDIEGSLSEDYSKLFQPVTTKLGVDYGQ